MTWFSPLAFRIARTRSGPEARSCRSGGRGAKSLQVLPEIFRRLWSWPDGGLRLNQKDTGSVDGIERGTEDRWDANLFLPVRRSSQCTVETILAPRVLLLPNQRSGNRHAGFVAATTRPVTQPGHRWMDS